MLVNRNFNLSSDIKDKHIVLQYYILPYNTILHVYIYIYIYIYVCNTKYTKHQSLVLFN